MKRPKIRKHFSISEQAIATIKAIAEDLDISQNQALEAVIRYAAEKATVKDLAKTAGLWAYRPKEGER